MAHLSFFLLLSLSFILSSLLSNYQSSGEDAHLVKINKEASRLENTNAVFC